ncbi:MAG TPA: response regulator transcription factor [Burkholderiales bacterium]|nr:response regulator transcription factor [Betaproteobacteria bacterium]HQR52665.1 response regulator transcription factor [Burkholderiales bacterium]
MRILVVEDDPVLGDGIQRSLAGAGYAIDRVDSGTTADAALAVQDYDLVILDLGLPGMDGLEVLRRLRHRGGRAPVLILTARDAVGDRVTGLDRGADDYLVKPFDLAELEARARALLRRSQFGAKTEIGFGPLIFDSVGRRASVNGQALELSAREIGVLEVLLARCGRVVAKEHLAERLSRWGEEIGANAVEVYVHRLRRKLEPSGVVIRTIRGLGYLIDKPR